MAQCKVEQNKSICNCTYSCSRKGMCCDCLHYHRRMGQLPACYFPKKVEAGYDRSIANFIATVQKEGTGYLR